MNMSEYSERVAEAIKYSGKTQEELAEITKIKQPSISYLTTSAKKPSSVNHALAMACGVSTNWLATGEGEMTNDPRDFLGAENIEPGPETHGIPLISFVQAGEFTKVENIYEVGDYEKEITVTKKYSSNAFALRIKGDSMLSASGPSFLPKSIITVEPAEMPNSGSFVVAKLADSDEATFKQLVHDGGKTYLKPLNPQYPIIDVTNQKDLVICGVVKQLIIEL